MIYQFKPSLLLLCIPILLYTSCSGNTSKNSRERTTNHLLITAKDSIRTNPELSKKLIYKYLHTVTDSADYYVTINYLIYYFIEADRFDSISYYQKKIEGYIANGHNNKIDSLKMVFYNVKGLSYLHYNKLDSAEYFFDYSYTFAKKAKYATYLPDICINRAEMKIRLGNYPDGIRIYRETLKIIDSLQINDGGLRFSIYFGLGQAYYAGLKNYDIAETFFKKAEGLYDKRSLNEKYVFCNNFGNFYYYKKDYSSALKYFLKARGIVEPLGVEYPKNLCYANLSDVYLHLQKTDSAKFFYNKSNAYFEKINDLPCLSYLSVVRAAIAIRENDLALAGRILKKYDNDKYYEPQIQTIRLGVLEDYYSRTGDYKKAFDCECKKNHLSDSLNSATVKNSIIETELRYKQDTAIIHQNYKLKSKNDEISNLRTGNIMWGIISVLLLTVIAMLFASRRRRIQLLRITQTETLTKLRIQNIRNRITPHFMFNVLNREIAKNINEEQKNVLFSLVKMLRRSLEMTENIEVSLRDELNFVEDYIQIEKPGLGADFDYKLLIDKNVNPELVKVLPMIIQIPVENAMKHALRPKTGHKELLVSISEHEDTIVIKIRDNGAGYQPNTLNTKGTGTGLKVIYQTIEILNTRNKEKIKFSIHSNGASESGTEVQIHIPLNYNFSL